MTRLSKSFWLLLFLASTTFLLASNVSQAQSTGERGKVTKRFRADFTTYSIVPGEELDTYRSGGSMSVEPGASSETGVYSESQGYQVVAAGRLKDHRFFVDFSVKDSGFNRGKIIESLSREIDLTDLKPESVEIAQEKTGRVYRVNIIPRVIETPATRVFRAEEMHLDHFSLAGCPLVLNDQDYLGTLGAGGGNLAFIDIPGLAKVEFSLIAMRGSSPEGVLKDGILTIRHEKTTLTIRNVRNGDAKEVLSGGAYQVFVRWSPASMTIEQHREKLKSTIQKLKTRLEDGDTTLSEDVVSRLQRAADSDRVVLSSNGITNVSFFDREPPPETDGEQK